MTVTAAQKRAIRIIIEEELLLRGNISPAEAADWITVIIERAGEAERIIKHCGDVVGMRTPDL